MDYSSIEPLPQSTTMFFQAAIISFLISSPFAMELRGGTPTKQRDLEYYIHCENTSPFDQVDLGCDSYYPICVDYHGHEPAASVEGDYCVSCVNTQSSPLFPDRGCPSDKPLCLIPYEDYYYYYYYEPKLNHAGYVCVENHFECFNTAAHGGVDEGCYEEAPVCVGYEGDPIDAGCYGYHCAVCVNSQQADHVADFGCPESAPRCVLEDLANPPLTKAGKKCVPVDPEQGRCTNDAHYGEIDSGCTLERPHCLLNDFVEPDFGEEGDFCDIYD